MPDIPPNAHNLNVEGLGFQQAFFSTDERQTVAHLHLADGDKNCWLTMTFDRPMTADNLRMFLQNKETKRKVDNLVIDYLRGKERQTLQEEGRHRITPRRSDSSLSSKIVSKVESSLRNIPLFKKESSPDLNPQVQLQSKRPLSLKAPTTLAGRFKELAPASRFFQGLEGLSKLLTNPQCQQFESLYLGLLLSTTREERIAAKSACDNFIEQLPKKQQKQVRKVYQECHERDHQAIQKNRFNQIGLLDSYSRHNLSSVSHEKSIADHVEKLPISPGRQRILQHILIEGYGSALSPTELKRFFLSNKFKMYTQGLQPVEIDKIKSMLIDAFVEEAHQLGELAA